MITAPVGIVPIIISAAQQGLCKPPEAVSVTKQLSLTSEMCQVVLLKYVDKENQDKSLGD